MLPLLVIVAVFVTPGLSLPYKGVRPADNSVDQPIVELVQSYGYPIETYTIETSDGYILGIQRVPYGVNSPEGDNKPVVFLFHDVLGSAIDWFSAGPEKGLGFLLADQGYDVWLGNARGSAYSRQHTLYDADVSNQYWDFSWDEIGNTDLPLSLDFVLEKTGQQKLKYVGYGQGSTAFFVLASEQPAYNDKISLAVALSPGVYLGSATSPFLKLLAKNVDSSSWLSSNTGQYEFKPTSKLLESLGQTDCINIASVTEICSNSLFLIHGYDSNRLNHETIQVVNTKTPSGAATKQLQHYAQEKDSGYFRKYDLGLLGNLLHYVSTSPPKYDLSQVTTQVALVYSANDGASASSDVTQLYRDLPNPLTSYQVSDRSFNHLDFIYADDVVPALYTVVISFLDRF